jgi:bifunctional DNA-binding transcriptional regulator/antitoxin component of YhaV-PrlF toxin-antitoxin module
MQETTKVGNKGEILPKKALREMAGIKPGDHVSVEARPGELLIRKIYSVEEALNLPVISEGTVENIEKELEEEAKLQEKLTTDDH